MNWLDGLEQRLAADRLDHWHPEVAQRCRQALEPGRHGDLPRWQAALEALPDAGAVAVDGSGPRVVIGSADDLPDVARETLRAALMALGPWRKGPFSLFGVEVDAEWRSDLKWARIERAGVPFAGRRVLDVGCGNGYYAFRMRGAGARRVIGVDPTLVHMHQFAACQRYARDEALDLLPIPLEALPPGQGSFDTVLSMGVLYHRRSPIDHLAALIRELAPGGQLLVESLVVPGDEHRLLCPPDRYARMRNVWFLPSAALLARWLSRLGMVDVQLLDESPTTVDEQRSTAWMPFESLDRALDPEQPTRTVEGHPAPLRAILTATRAG